MSSAGSGVVLARQFIHGRNVPELWYLFHNDLDLDRNGQLDSLELSTALAKAGQFTTSIKDPHTKALTAGIQLSSETLSEFITYLTSSPTSNTVSFGQFRDFLLLLPRKASTAEIYRYYEVKKFMGDDGRGPARVNMEGLLYTRALLVLGSLKC